MTQYARPDGTTIADSIWVNEQSNQTNLHLSVDEAAGTSGQDDDKIQSDSDGMTTPDWIKFTLSDIDDPESAADHKVVYRAVGAGMGSAPSLIWSLRQGGTDLGIGNTNSSLNNSAMGGSISAHTHTLSTGEANSITDYDDLQIWLKRSGVGEMGDGIKITQVWFECPDASAGGGVTTSPAFLLFME